jgi:hypothetical protein
MAILQQRWQHGRDVRSGALLRPIVQKLTGSKRDITRNEAGVICAD